jgi:hypothetical protein
MITAFIIISKAPSSRIAVALISSIVDVVLLHGCNIRTLALSAFSTQSARRRASLGLFLSWLGQRPRVREPMAR